MVAYHQIEKFVRRNKQAAESATAQLPKAQWEFNHSLDQFAKKERVLAEPQTALKQKAEATQMKLYGTQFLIDALKEDKHHGNNKQRC
jgi:hypothetical protein